MNTIRLLQAVALAFGAREIGNAITYHKQNKKKWAIASLCMGVFACICVIVSVTGIL